MTDNQLGSFDIDGKLAGAGKFDINLLNKFENALLNLDYPRADDVSLYTSLMHYLNENPVLRFPTNLPH